MSPKDRLIIGNWYISGLQSNGEEDGIIVFRTDGICIQFLSSDKLPEIAPTFRLYFDYNGEDEIVYKMSPKGTPWTRKVEWTDTGWTMISDDRPKEDGTKWRFPCRRISDDELPAWFDEMVEVNIGVLQRRARREAL